MAEQQDYRFKVRLRNMQPFALCQFVGRGPVESSELLDLLLSSPLPFRSINQSKRKTSNANGQTNLGHKHKAPDHNHEATQPMVDLPHTS